MSSEARTRTRPGRAVRAMMQVPVLLYRIGLGRQLGARNIMLLYTIGRRTGRERVSGLNFALDGTTIYAAAGWGPGTGWYRNMLAKPQVEVQIGSRRVPAQARPVTDEAEQRHACALLAALDGGPPSAARGLLKRAGFDYEAERERAFGEPARLTLVAFELAEPLPAEEPSRGAWSSRLPFIAVVAGALVLGAVLRGRRRRARV